MEFTLIIIVVGALAVFAAVPLRAGDPGNPSSSGSEPASEGSASERSSAPTEPADPNLVVACEGYEVRKIVEEKDRRTRFVWSAAEGAPVTLWEAEWKPEDYFDEQMRRVYDRREDDFRAFCANVVGPKKSARELVVAFQDARDEWCCWTLDIYALDTGGVLLSRTNLKYTRPPEVADLNTDGVDEVLVGDYRAYELRELPREFAPHLRVALCADSKGAVSDCTSRFPVLARQDIARLKKELSEVSTKQMTAIPKRRGLAIGIVASYARLNNARQGLAEIIKLCPERECKDWVQTKTPEALEHLSGPAKY